MRGLASLIILASALIVTSVYSQDSTQLKGPKGVDYGVQGRAIGPIKPTDTLWRIAVKVRPDNSVSIYQVMQALYNKNPNSFLEQNLNHMQSGAYLNIPTLAEIKSVSSELARQRSEQDDKLWEKKKNGTLTQSEINTAQTKVTQARKVDVDEAKKELQKELNDIKTDQSNRLVELQQQFKSSVNNVEEILVENNKLKKQLTGISQELKNLREQLGQDSEIQLQLKELIVKQNEIIAQQKIKDAKQDAEFDLGALLSNPLVLILLMTIPALLIIFAVVMLLRKRANNTEQNNQEDEEFLPQTPVYSSDDSDDVVSAASHDDPIIPDPLDDLSVQLDDGIADDVLLDDDVAFDDSLDDSNLLDQDELESLLSDDIIFDDEDGQDDDELDIFMQQGFDEPVDDNLEDTIDLDLNTSQNSDDILSADDLDSLFDEDDSLPEIESSDSDKVAPESGDSHDEISAFSEELASEDDDFDIDDLLESEQSSIPSNTEELVEENDDFDLDDIDSLIDEVSEQDDALPEKQSSATELVEESDDFDLDDIDSLIDEASEQGDDLLEEQNSATELVEENDDFDLDDIDSLIGEANVQGDDLLEEQSSATELVEENDDFDLDDIDSLIDEANVQGDDLLEEQSSATELVEENDDFDLDDIDSLIDEANEQDDDLLEEQSSTTQLVEENDGVDIDDIDSLIDEANEQDDDLLEEQSNTAELVEEADDFDLDDIDDIDSLIDEVSEQGEEEQPETPLEEQNNTAELVEEADDFDLDDIDDIDSLIDEVSEQDDEEQPEAPLEEQNNTAELVEEADDFDLDDIDDIDSLIDEVSEQSEQGDEEQPETPLEEQKNTAELVEEADDFDLDDIDDIDSLIDNLDDDLDEHDTQIDTALAESVEDLEKAQQELNSDDAESVASSFSENTESALESEPELAVEEQDDFGDSIIEDYSDTSQTLLDPEDALEEYNDDNLKSVDELLNELQQASDDEEYVEPPQWSVDDFNDVTEAELGDDPLGIENDESELLADESVPDVAAPSEELDVDEYPELDLNDDAILTADEQQAFTPQELQGDNLDGDAKGMASSQAEQDLANSLLAGGNLDSLNDDFDDELLIENDFSELDSEQQNEDELLAITSPPEVDTSNSSEQQLNDDVSDDLLNEVDDIQIEQLNEELDGKLINEQTNVDREAALMPTELPHNGEVASDDELDDEFMADLTQTDFDALLNELADADELDIADSSEFDVDFNNLLSDEIDTDESALAPQPTVNSNTIEQTSKDEFVDIDALLEQSDDADTEHEPYDDVNMDVGLGDFDSLLAGDNPTDVDAESGGYSAKLDLARAYIEIDDFDSALKVIEDVINKGPEEVQQEALSLKAKLK
ncbi:FimV/HubP family polar landmark protein [Pseudoalteromonas translucida]|uniref:Orphan protein putative membrane protein n=1 Tax=Pseudoalteromonas translucida (strain TAC 125) TaxID=326442 RepID=Q3IF39_PSET1|nr:FimV/HubP family polar landmark protein [Pseudoalteromonas translucida]CAI87132.1 putative orphan protein; putative membrane protein [Pseudoalteromonas translucida]